VLMRPHDRAVDHGVFIVRVGITSRIFRTFGTDGFFIQ
jgi:hypothetical protein